MFSSDGAREQRSHKYLLPTPRATYQLSGCLGVIFYKAISLPFIFSQALSPPASEDNIWHADSDGEAEISQERFRTQVCRHMRRPCVSHQLADLWTTTILELNQLPHLMENAYELINHL